MRPIRKLGKSLRGSFDLEWRITTLFGGGRGRSYLSNPFISVVIVAAILIWSKKQKKSFYNFYSFVTNSFSIPDDYAIQSKQDFVDTVRTLPKQFQFIANTHVTFTLIYVILFAALFVFSSPINSMRELKLERMSGYAYLSFLTYTWIFISLLSHLPIFIYLIEIPFSLFPYFYLASFLTVSLCLMSMNFLFRQLFVFHIGVRRRIFEILHSCSALSLICSTLYAHCGNTIDTVQNSYVCVSLFNSIKESRSDVPPVLTMWLTGVSIIVMNYLVEGMTKGRFIFSDYDAISSSHMIVEQQITTHSASPPITPTNTTADILDHGPPITSTTNSTVSSTGLPTQPLSPPPSSDIDFGLANARQVSKEVISLPDGELTDEKSTANDYIHAPVFVSPPHVNTQPTLLSSDSDTDSDDTPHHLKRGISPSPSWDTRPERRTSTGDTMKGAAHEYLLRTTVQSLEPTDTCEMVSWFSMSLGWVLLDLVMTLGVFIDRFDRRTLMAAFIENWNRKLNYKSRKIAKRQRKKRRRSKRTNHSSDDDDNDEVSISSASVNAFEAKCRQSNDTPIGFTDETSQSQSRQTEPIPRPISYDKDLYSATYGDVSLNSIAVQPLTDRDQVATSCFTYLEDRNGLYFDFMADCGDGFNPSYQIARLLAQPKLHVQYGSGKTSRTKVLPRGELLIIGGDLAYPGPTLANYERKLFRVFEDALAPPPHFRRSEVAYSKPDLPRGVNLKTYKGPTCFAIPGNHDWYDGLKTFLRLICNRNWMGGWLLPQIHSYYAIALPHKWWIFAVDYSLVDDINCSQFKYFADIADTRFGSDDKVIVVSHFPDWIFNDHMHHDRPQDMSAPNLRYLIHHVLKGRVKLRLAGDMHHYTRHEPSYRPHVESIKTNGLRPNRARSYSDPNLRTPVPNTPIAHSLSPFARNASETNLAAMAEQSDQSTPSLIVSGGGGAFMHPVHPFAKNIEVDNVNYERVSEYPSVTVSRKLAFYNIFGFRKRNLQFDIFGGILYYLLVFSVFPLCDINVGKSDNKKWTLADVFWAYCINVLNTCAEIFECSYVSLGMALLGFALCVLLCNGKTWKQNFWWGSVHALFHFMNAVSVCVVMEMVITAAIDHKLVGIKTPFDTFVTHFPTVYSALQFIDDKYTNGYIVKLLKIMFTVVDITGFHVQLRSTMCGAKVKQTEFIFGRFEFPFSLQTELYAWLLPSRFHRALYHCTTLFFYWIFSVPVASFVLGLYLFFSVNVLGIHFTEAFSSLRSETHKNFLRCHITENGALEIFAIGVDKSPRKWIQDPKWTGRGTLLKVPLSTSETTTSNIAHSVGRRYTMDDTDLKINSGHRRNKKMGGKEMTVRDLRGIGPSFEWKKPSRWKPKEGVSKYAGQLKIIDHIFLK